MPCVDMEPSRRLAYAFVEPACADPGLFIRRALERRSGDPPVRLAPSSHGTMMVIFGHPFFREVTLQRGPIDMGGHRLRLVRHEEADFRVLIPYKDLVELAATNSPPEHGNEPGIRTAFQAIGQVCCVARSTLREVLDHRGSGIADYSVVRVLVLITDLRKVKPKLLVCNPNGKIAVIADVRVVAR